MNPRWVLTMMAEYRRCNEQGLALWNLKALKRGPGPGNGDLPLADQNIYTYFQITYIHVYVCIYVYTSIYIYIQMFFEGCHILKFWR